MAKNHWFVVPGMWYTVDAGLLLELLLDILLLHCGMLEPGLCVDYPNIHAICDLLEHSGTGAVLWTHRAHP